MFEELPVELHLSLIAAAGPEQIESLEPSAVVYNLSELPGFGVKRGLVGVHVAEDYVEQGGHVERYLVGTLHGGQGCLHHGLVVLLDFAFHVELVEQK